MNQYQCCQIDRVSCHQNRDICSMQNQFDLTTRPLKKFAIPPSLHTVCLVEDQHKSKGFKTCANARFDQS